MRLAKEHHLCFLQVLVAFFSCEISLRHFLFLIKASSLATLLQNSFHLDCQANSDSDYTEQRQFSDSADFPMDEEENNRRVATIGHPLTHPVSMPASNGLRYNAQQPVMQDVP